MKISSKGLDLIKHFESFKAKPYLCSNGTPTIGYGTTVYPTGQNVTLKNKAISKEAAIKYLMYDCERFERQVNQYFDDVSFKKLSQDEFDACVSLCYNTGTIRWTCAAFLGADLVGKKDVADWWMKIIRNQNGGTEDGLRRRRMSEIILIYTGELVYFANGSWDADRLAIDKGEYMKDTGLKAYEELGLL